MDTGLGTLSIDTQSHWLDQPRNIIRNAFAVARSSKSPSFDVVRCVTVLGPTRFLFTFWEELDASAQIGDLELSRRFERQRDHDLARKLQCRTHLCHL